MLNTTKLRTWIPVLAFIVMLVIIGTVDFLLYERHVREIERTAQEGLAAVADLKVGQIIRWLEGQRKDAVLLQHDNLLADEVERWFQQGAPEGELEQNILARLDSLRQISKYDGITLLDTVATQRLSVMKDQEFESHDTGIALQAMRDNAVKRSEIHWSAKQKLELELFVPLAVPGTTGPRVIGAVVFNIDPYEFFFPFIQSWPGESPSGETLLVRRNGNKVLFLNELRHRKDTALRLSLPIEQSLLPETLVGLQENTAVTEGKDYRGVAVIAAVRQIPDTDWILVAKLDRAEVNAPIGILVATAGALVVLFIVLASVITGLWWRKQHAQHLAELAGEQLQRQALAQHFDYATKYARDVILLLDVTGRLVECNESAVAAYGYTRDELLQLTLSELRSPQTVAAIPGDLERAARAGGITFETEHRRKDGSILPVEVSMLLIESEGKRFYQNIIRDITERKQGQLSLERESKRYKALMETAIDGIHIIDQNACLVEANTAFLRMIGYEKNEAIGIHVNDWDALLSREQIMERLIRLQTRSEIFETQWRRKDGTILDVEISVNALEIESLTWFYCAGRDITARKRAEEILYLQSSALNAAVNAIMITDIKGNVEWVNPAHATLTGYSPEETIGKKPQHLVKSDMHDDDFYKNMWETIIAGNIWRGETINRRKDRSVYIEDQTISPVRNDQGTITHFVSIKQDITERKHTEERLALSTFALNHSHEGTFLMDENACIIDVNDEACRALNYTSEELLKMKLTDIDPDFTMQMWYQYWKKIKKTGSASLETRHRRKDGTTFPIEIFANYVEYNGHGYNLALVRNITDRKQAQDKILRLNRVYKMLSEINSLIVHVHDRQELLNESCRIAVEDGGFRMTWIGLLTPGEKVVVPKAWAGHEEGFLQHVHVSIDDDDPGRDSASSRALRSMEPVIHNYLAEEKADFPWKQEALNRGYNAVAGLPLIVAGKTVGVMSLYAAGTGFFDEEEMKLLTELSSDISYALQNIGHEEKLEFLASYDPLTGLANRTLFDDHLNSVLTRAGHSNKKVALLVCDLRQFRHINSAYGRETGDLVLQETARRLREQTTDPVNIARISADYFALILHDVGEATRIGHLFKNTLFPALNQPLLINDQKIQLYFSGGIAVYPADGTYAEKLYRNAEAALKKGKLLNEQYMFYRPEMTARIAETLQMENKLRTALKEKQFMLYYQPKIDAHTREMVGLEALIRWNDPETGLVQPDKFMPLLEESGLILEVGQWALDQAASDYRKWQKLSDAAPRIAVNVSAVQLRQKDFVAQVEKAIRRSGKAVAMDIELTESLIMTDIEDNITKLKAIRMAGLGIAIDDFGTGYSSLSYIAKLPINALKIDRSFINNMTSQEESMSIVSAIITLAHSLDFKVIAEGVETEEQAKFLTLLKCDEMQGYLFNKPLLPAEITKLLKMDKFPN